MVAIPTTSSRLHIWDQFTGEVTSNWTVSGDNLIHNHIRALRIFTFKKGINIMCFIVGCAEFLVQCNSTVLVLYDKDDQGNLYTYGLDKM